MALTVDKNCGFLKTEAYMTKTWIFFGKEEWTPESYHFRAFFRSRECGAPYQLSKEEFELATLRQRRLPILLMTMGQRHWWWFCDAFYYTNEASSDPVVIKGLLIQQQHRAFRKEERARAAANGERPPKQPKAKNGANRQGLSSNPSSRSPYQILDVHPSATIEEIKSAYRKKVNQYHPDRVASLGIEFTALANTMMKEINKAYEELSGQH